MAHESNSTAHGAKTLPADLAAPPIVDGWKSRALVIGAIFAVVALILAFLGQAQDGLGWDHLLRAWVLGMMLTFGLAVGGLALLMVQYCSGGKWGLLLRRPLEAMSRTLPLIFVYWLVVVVFIKKLYLWAQFPTDSDTAAALKAGVLSEIQKHCIDFKRPMLNPDTFIAVGVLCFAIWAFYMMRLNSMALKRDSDVPENTPFWIKKFENLSGPGIVVYSLTMTAGAIYWVMSMDPTWYFLGLRPHLPCRSGLPGAGLHHHRCHLPFKIRALQDDSAPD